MKKHFSRIVRHKKGLFYMYVSSIMLLVIIAVFLTKNDYNFSDKQKVTETRIESINDFISDIESDSKRVMYVSAFRSLIALEDHVSKTGTYLNDTEEMFRVAFYNGTIDSETVDVLINSTYQDYLQKLRQLSLLSGIDVFINVTEISLYHTSPWSVEVVVTADVYVNDTRGLAYWQFDKNYTTQIPLQNIKDPVYGVGTYGKVPNTIRHTNVTDFINQATNSTANLQMHNNNSLYYASALAPSFIMRLEGNFSPSPYGIESLVYIPELDVQEVSYSSSKSVVDYVFFSNVTGYIQNACSVQNMPSWFKIDLNHTSTYEVNSLNYTVC